MSEQFEWPEGYDGHRRMQQELIAENSTLEQRVHWLEDMLLFLWRNNLIPPKTFLTEWPEE